MLIKKNDLTVIASTFKEPKHKNGLLTIISTKMFYFK